MPKVFLSQQSVDPRSLFRAPTASSAIKISQSLCLQSKPSQPIQLTSSMGETLLAAYSEVEKRVYVCILKNGQFAPIKSEYFPPELKYVRSAQQLLAILTHSYVRTAWLSNGDCKLYISGRLLGGQPYQEALTNFKRYFEELVNPFTATEIRTRLQEKCQLAYRLSDGLDGWLDGFNLPREVIALTAALSEAIKNRAGDLRDEAGLEGLKAELSTVFSSLNNAASDENLWPELHTLLSIKEVKAIENSQVARMLREINKDAPSVEQLRDLVHTWLNEEEINRIDEELQATDEELNLDTLLSEVILKKPVVNTSIITCWERELDFFKDKTVYLQDPVSHERHSGTILKAERTKMGGFTFHLDGGCKLNIGKLCNISLEEIVPYDLLKGIIGRFINEGESFLLEARDSHETIIPPGRYTLRKRKYAKGFGRDLLTTPNYEIDLADEQGVLHTLRIDYRHASEGRFKWEEVSKIEYDCPQKNKRNIAHEISSFKRHYRALKTVEKSKNFSKIYKANAHQSILIKDEGASDRARLERLSQIEEAINQLINNLIVNDFQQLSALVDHWIAHGLQSIDLRLLEGTPLKQKIEEISEQYRKDLGVDRLPEELLLQIVREANYSVKISKDKSVLIARTMNLLNKAFKHAHRLSGKDAVVVIGNTGSGKSTSICHLLKARLTRFVNKVGDTVYQVAKPDRALPKIGQRIGTSKTLYSQGYTVPGSSTTIVDCAGFDDTRGGDYELCANLSIDLIEEKLHKIQALLLVIPFQAFTLDKGNPVISLAHSVEERFPRIFDQGSKDFRQLFLLVTKKEQVPNDTRGLFSQRLETLCSEERQNIRRLKGEGAEDRDLGQNYSRLKIWESLRQMDHDKRVSLLDPLNLRQRGELLRQYPSAGGTRVDKIQYVQVMNSEEMQKKFGGTVVLSTHTWTEVIFKEYLGSYAHAISLIETAILEQKQARADVVDLTAAKREHVTELNSQVLKLESLIQQLQGGGDADIDAGTKAEIDQTIKGASQTLQSLLAGDSSLLVQKQSERLKLLGEIDQINREVIAKTGIIAQLTQEIDRMSAGIRTKALWSMGYEPNAEISLRTYKEGARQRNIDEVRASEEADFKPGIQKVIAKDYRGQMVHDPLISKRYRLVPKNREERIQFLATGIGGDHKAILSGRNYKLDARRSTPEGNKIKYAFTTTWKGEPIPEIKIVHEIPNIDYYEELIINKVKDKQLAKEQIIELRLRLEGGAATEGKLQVLGRVEQEIGDLEKRITAHQQKLVEERVTISMNHLNTLMARQQVESAALTQQIQLLQASVPTTEQNITSLQKQLEEKRKDKRHFAAAIYGQLGAAKVLREFSQLVVRRGDGEEELQGEIIKSCREFLSAYDAQFVLLEQECCRDLGLEIASSLKANSSSSSLLSTHQDTASSSSSAQ